MRIFNTLTRQVEDLVPRIPGRIGLYSCGPTVYGYAHIGNMRTYIFNDTLRRTLEYFGYDVTHVMNITDVGHLTDDGDDGEDKMELGCRRENTTAWDIARKYTDAFFDHAAKLQIKKPSIVCRATDHIREQIEMVRSLEDKGYVYKTEDGLYFDTSRFADYPRLGKLDVEGMREGHRIELGHRRHKTDFAVWKLSPSDERRAMEWDSPWGRGFPGWHLECSAMAMHFLGKELDIHTGGVDHIPIHHTNEIAQSQCASGHAPFARYWMHGEFLVLETDKDEGGAAKMSKSLGNVLTVQTLVDRGFDPLAYRMLILQTHYRKQLRFSYDGLVSAARGLERLCTLAGRVRDEAKGAQYVGKFSERGLAHKREFDAGLANDLNTPQSLATAFAVLDDAALTAPEKLALIESFDAVFGLNLLRTVKAQSDVSDEMAKLLAERNAARQAKNWPEADRLRKEITARGYDILDSADGVATLKRRL